MWPHKFCGTEEKKKKKTKKTNKNPTQIIFRSSNAETKNNLICSVNIVSYLY